MILLFGINTDKPLEFRNWFDMTLKPVGDPRFYEGVVNASMRPTGRTISQKLSFWN